jgi:aspartate-semialdehyde dehydrogenase
MKSLNIAIVGATGMVGRKMIEVLSQSEIPVNHLYLFSSLRSKGEIVNFNGISYKVEVLDHTSFDNDIDVALFSAGGDVSKQYVPIAAAKGIIVIDNSSAWRMDENVPLIVPEVNKHALKLHHNIIANPNCSTIQSVVPLNVIHKLFGIKRIVYTTYQAVSGSGIKGINALELGNYQTLYSVPIDQNVIPQIDIFLEDGSTKEEQKMIEETKKILEDESINITATCVRVPVVNGHSVAINVECLNNIDLPLLTQTLTESPGIKFFPQNTVITPRDVDGLDDVFVSRLRLDSSVKNGLNLWVVADNVRKGAALNAVQILSILMEEIR